jgi:hypothetical protein
MFSASKASPQARDMVWKFTKDGWETLKKRYQGQFLLSRIIDVSSNYVTVGYLQHVCLTTLAENFVSFGKGCQ